MGVVVSAVIMSAALVAAPTPAPSPSADRWPLVGVGAVLVGAATATSATVVAVGQQAVVDNADAAGADRQRALAQLPVLWSVAGVGAVVVVAGVAVLVWRTMFADDDEAAP